MSKRLKSKTLTVTENKQSKKKKRQFIKNDTNDWAKSTVSKKSVFTKKKTKKKRFIY